MNPPQQTDGWLLTPSANQWLLVASMISIVAAITESYLAVTNNASSALPRQPDWVFWLVAAMALIACAAQLFVLIAMLLYAARNPAWKWTTKLLLLLLQVFLTVYASLAIYFFSFRVNFVPGRRIE